MCKKFLQMGKEMSAASFVEHASLLAGKMVARESRGPGDTDNAMRRLENSYGIPYAALWALRYRKPKSVAVEVYAAIVCAYDRHCDEQAKIFSAERGDAHPQGWLAQAFVRAADALAGEEGGQ